MPIIGWGLLVFLTLGLSLRDYEAFQFGAWSDDSRYVLLARSFVRGEDYGLHFGPVPAVTSYPFLFPLILTPFVAFAPDRLDAGKAVSLAATLFNLSLLFWGWPLLSRWRSRWWALTTAALYALSPHVLSLAHTVMSEPLFTTFVLLALLASERCAREARPTWGWHALLGLATTCAVCTRSAGIALAAAMVLRLVWQRRRQSWRPLVAMAGGALLLLVPVITLTPVALEHLVPWVYLESVPRPLHQGGARAPLLEQVSVSVQIYSTSALRNTIVPIGGGRHEQEFGERLGIPQLPTVTSLWVTAIVLLGALWSTRGALRPGVLLFELFYAGMAVVWHDRGSRMLYPLLPFLTLQFLVGIRLTTTGLVRVLPAAARRRLTWAPRALLILAVGFLSYVCLARSLPATKETSVYYARDLRLGTIWLRERSERGALVLAEEPIQVHLYSDRPVAPARDVFSEDQIRRLGVRYILVGPRLMWNTEGKRQYDEHTETVLLPLVESMRGGLELVYESPPGEMVRVYRVAQAGHP